MQELTVDNREPNEDERLARWQREMDAWHREHGPERDRRTLWFSAIWRALRERFIDTWAD
jgi:hypothetical protein